MFVMAHLAVTAVGLALSLIGDIAGDPTELPPRPSEAATDGTKTDLPVNGPKVTPCGVAKVTIGGRDVFFDAAGHQISKDEFNQAVAECGKSKKRSV